MKLNYIFIYDFRVKIPRNSALRILYFGIHPFKASKYEKAGAKSWPVTSIPSPEFNNIHFPVPKQLLGSSYATATQC